MNPYAILVVTADGDTHDLLGPAPYNLGGCPACVSEASDGWVGGMRGAPNGQPTWALPLLWNGEQVDEGYDRARRVLLRLKGSCCAEPRPPVAVLLQMGRDLVGCHVGSRMVVLELVDGSLVEAFVP